MHPVGILLRLAAGVRRPSADTSRVTPFTSPTWPVGDPTEVEVSTSLAGQGWAVAGVAPIPRLWTAFVLAWLPVFGLVVWGLVQDPPAASHLAVTLLALAALVGLYLELTLRGALTNDDLAPVGPGPALMRRRLLLLAAMTALVVTLILLVPTGEMWWLGMHAIVAAGLTLPTAYAAGATAGLVGLAVASAWLVTNTFDVVLLLQIAFGAGAIAIRQLTIAVGQLRAAREELARLAVAEERLRFARDLHDLLGHSLSVIVLKSELAGRLLPAAPERAAVEVADVERAAREALRQVRAAVAGYRQPALRSELAAARELLAAAGIVASIDDAAGPLSPELDALLAWAVREGVTNVIRHSRARHCAIRVSRHGEVMRVEVTDDGRGLTDGSPSGGSGLAGLSERAVAHGGRLQAGPLPAGGFRLLLEAPAVTATDGGRS